MALVELADDLAEPGDVAGAAVDLLEQHVVRVDLASQAEPDDGRLRLLALDALLGTLL